MKTPANKAESMGEEEMGSSVRLAAEAQVSALQAQVDGLRGVVDSAYSEIIRMERASLVGRTHDQWERAFRSGVKAARQSFGARIATLSQPPADEPAKGGEGHAR